MNQESRPSSMNRRGFLAGSAVLLGANAMAQKTSPTPKPAEAVPPQTEKPKEQAAAPTGPFVLAPLPWAENALEPHISGKTIGFHYGKHHKTYIDKLNKAVEGKNLAGMKLEEVIVETGKDPSTAAIFNNAAQAWNHHFYWHSLSPKRQRPSGALLHRLEKDFGSYERFADAFGATAIGQFGSGWAWLVEKDGKLQVVATSNAETPMAQRIKCLLTVDVWEHAYYVDYRNERERYVSAIVDRLNWEFAEKNLA